MKKTKNVLYISLGLIILGLLSTLLMDDSLANKIATIITMITAIIGAVALFIQFKKNKDVNQAEFIINYGKYFYEVNETNEIEKKLEYYEEKPNIFEEKDRIGIVKALVWCEGLSVLIQKNVIDLDLIDNLFSYRFFTIVHNPYIQKTELIPYMEYYKGIFALHKIWCDYKKRTNQIILGKEYSLEKLENYEEFCKKGDITDHINY